MNGLFWECVQPGFSMNKDKFLVDIPTICNHNQKESKKGGHFDLLLLYVFILYGSFLAITVPGLK